MRKDRASRAKKSIRDTIFANFVKMVDDFKSRELLTDEQLKEENFDNHIFKEGERQAKARKDAKALDTAEHAAPQPADVGVPGDDEDRVAAAQVHGQVPLQGAYPTQVGGTSPRCVPHTGCQKQAHLRSSRMFCWSMHA